MSFYKFDNFYVYSTQLIRKRFFYLSKKFPSDTFIKISKTPLSNVSVNLSVKWSQRNIYFIWDLLRTVFYFQLYFLKNPIFSLYNSKYVKLQIKFNEDETGFKNFLSYLVHFKLVRPKLLTKNYLTKQNHYILNFHESQFQKLLPKNTVFDFYNWKTKVPVFFSPSLIRLKKNEKFQNFSIRVYYVQLYKQLFNYRNLKLLIFVLNAVSLPQIY